MQYFTYSPGMPMTAACVLSLLYPLASRISNILGAACTYTTALLHTAAITLLIYLHLTNNFSFAHVYHNSHTALPVIYKIGSIWSSYEGANLLLTWMLNVCAVLLTLSIKPSDYRKVTLSVQSLLCFGFSLFGVIFANPFHKVLTLNTEGMGFNPILQDVALAIHPPVLFSGYAAFSGVFSMTIAALVLRVDPKQWAAIIQNWTVGAWTSLTLGITLGGWWAYRELGWGGFWSWDPVENVSLMPWLLGMALIHLLPMVRKDGIYCNLAALLSLTAFISSLYGVFLTRSGLITSIHAFTSDTGTGLYLLTLANVVAGSGLGVFIYFYRSTNEVCHFDRMPKATAASLNTALALTSFLVVLTGTTYPIILELMTGQTVSINAPYYNSIFSVLTTITLMAMAVIPHLDNESKHLNIPKVPTIFALSLTPLTLFAGSTKTLLLMPVLPISSILEGWYNKIRASTHKKLISLRTCASTTAHLGFAIFIIGAISSNTLQENVTHLMKEHSSVNVHGFDITLLSVSPTKGQNYEGIRGTFILKKQGKLLQKLLPESRFYTAEAARSNESSIYHGLAGDLYITIGEAGPYEGIVAQIHYKSLVGLVWIGASMMAAGGIISITATLRREKRSPKARSTISMKQRSRRDDETISTSKPQHT